MTIRDYLLMAAIFGGLGLVSAANALALHFGLHASWQGAWDGGAMMLCLEAPLVMYGVLVLQMRAK